ncbi:hypothetical protein KNE206_76660 [Kitasatospora sp. NE20-6]|uniref:hypothetical protein n=1 Tax=Kitasatospora sp. NE20-6 TaxID=2859066 RepID=UPI0034DB9796
MTTPHTVLTDRPERNGHVLDPQLLSANPTSVRFSVVDGRRMISIATPDGREVQGTDPLFAVSTKPSSLSFWLVPKLGLLHQCNTNYPINRIRAAIDARRASVQGESTALAQFGRIALNLNRSERWTEALSTALLGDWIDPLYDGTGLGLRAIDRLRSEARTAHQQLMPLWQRRTYGNRRVTLLENPVYEGATLRDLLADRYTTDDPLLNQAPGDRRLAAVLQRLDPTERAVVLAYGRPGVSTWTEAAELVGAGRPEAFGARVRRKVRRAVAELQRRDSQRAAGPTGLWTSAPSGGAR